MIAQCAIFVEMVKVAGDYHDFGATIFMRHFYTPPSTPATIRSALAAGFHAASIMPTKSCSFPIILRAMSIEATSYDANEAFEYFIYFSMPIASRRHATRHYAMAAEFDIASDGGGGDAGR